MGNKIFIAVCILLILALIVSATWIFIADGKKAKIEKRSRKTWVIAYFVLAIMVTITAVIFMAFLYMLATAIMRSM